MSETLRKVLALLLCGVVQAATAQEVVRPLSDSFWRRWAVAPYQPTEVGAIELSNSGRWKDLIRGGKLYLTAQDAILLALDNNIDIEVARYTPLTLQYRLERAQAGGALPGVPSGAAQSATVTSGQGVLGSQAAAGVSGSNTGAANRGAGNATIAQIGPVTQTLDPTFQESTSFSHRTIPQPNLVQTGSVLVQDQRIYNGSVQQGLLTGGSVTMTYKNQYLNENAASDVLNPSLAPNFAISAQQSLLQGFGKAVNGRNITVAKMNLANTDLSFRSQVSGIVVNVLNNYYSLSAAYDDLKAKEGALETARKFLEENNQRLALGALARLDIVKAQSQAASAEQGVVDSRAAIAQRELQLKNLISRTGVADPAIANIPIVPVDRIVIPASDDLPPLKELMAKALANRPELLSDKASLATAEVSALGTTNGVKPSLTAFATHSNAGLGGTRRLANGQTADPYFGGGVGTGLGQIIRDNFPSETAGVFFRASIGNRQAQADQGIEQLQMRQQQLTTARDMNQAQVDVMNAVVALRQARAAYEAAVQNKLLQQQLLDSEEKKFQLGASTPFNVVQQQRDLATAQASELSAMVKYESARINLDQSTGATLEANHITVAAARAGRQGVAKN